MAEHWLDRLAKRMAGYRASEPCPPTEWGSVTERGGGPWLPGDLRGTQPCIDNWERPHPNPRSGSRGIQLSVEPKPYPPQLPFPPAKRG